MLLAKAGAEVTLFERHGKVGGRSATIVAPSAVGTFRFDMGPTFFLYPRVLADIFAACDLSLDREAELIRLDPMYRLVFEAGGAMLASGDMTKLAAEIARIAPADAAALPRFMADNRAKLAAFRPILESPFHGPLNMLRPNVLRSLKMMRPHRSVDQDLANISAMSGCGWRSRSSPNISACRRSAAPACSPSCRSWNTSSACSIRAAAAVR